MNDNFIDIRHILYLSDQISIIKNKMINATTKDKKEFYADQIQALQNTLEKIKNSAY